MKKTFSVITFIVLFNALMAQTSNKITETYLITGPWNQYGGDMTYSYVVNEEGERIKNGPVTVKGQQDETYDNVTIKGNYSLSAGIKNGKMNGPMSVKANYHGVERTWTGDVVEDHTFSFSGAFVDGIPNGNFVTSVTGFGKSNVNYKNGVLVGSYSVSEALDKRIITIKGSFDANGKMIGIWDISDLGDESQWEFIKGIRIRVSSKKEESTPNQIAMAKKYASGSITPAELEKQGYFVVRDSIPLGDYASDLMFLHRIADWEVLGECNISDSYYVYFTYLYHVLPCPDKRLKAMVDDYRESGGKHTRVLVDDITKSYVTEYYDQERGQVLTRSLSEEQISKIDEVARAYYRENAYQNIGGLLNMSSHVNGIKSGFLDVKESVEQEAYSLALRRYSELLKEVDRVNQTYTMKLLENAELTSDGLYYVIPNDDKDPFVYRYLRASAYEEYLALTKEIYDYKGVMEKVKQESAKIMVSQFIEGISSDINNTHSLLDLVKAIKNRTVRLSAFNSNLIQNRKTVEEVAFVILGKEQVDLVDYEEVWIDSQYLYVIHALFKQGDKEITLPVDFYVDSRGSIIEGAISIEPGIYEQANKEAGEALAEVTLKKMLSGINGAINEQDLLNAIRYLTTHPYEFDYSMIHNVISNEELAFVLKGRDSVDLLSVEEVPIERINYYHVKAEFKRDGRERALPVEMYLNASGSIVDGSITITNDDFAWAKQEAGQDVARIVLDNMMSAIKASKNIESLTKAFDNLISSVSYFRPDTGVTSLDMASVLSKTSSNSLLAIEETKYSAKNYSSTITLQGFRVKAEFIKAERKKTDPIAVEFVMSKTGVIVPGSIVVPMDLLERARKEQKVRQSVSKYLQF